MAGQGSLVVVGTPIGNLADLSPRAAEALRGADVVACEDTRRTAPLLRHAGADAPMVAVHQHNEAARAADLVARMRAGARVALVSDAGMPLVSDPGARLVRAALDARAAGRGGARPERGHRRPGRLGPGGRGRLRLPRLRAAARGRAAAAGGAPGRAWRSRPSPSRARARLPGLLAEIAARAGPTAPWPCCRELTKLHEEVVRGTAAEVAGRLAEPPRGEVTVVVGAAPRGGRARRGPAARGPRRSCARPASARPGRPRWPPRSARPRATAPTGRPSRGGTGRRAARTNPIRLGFVAEALLPHHADLLRQRGAAHRPRVHDDHGRHHRAPSPPARRGRLLPHGHRRARLQLVASAAEAGRTPREHADLNAERFRDLGGVVDATYDFFIRTTDPEHDAAVERVMERLRESGRRLPGHATRAGTAPRARRFYAEAELHEGRLCPIHSTPVEWLEEENWFFRLSAYRDRLLAHYDANPDWVLPPARCNEARAHDRGLGLEDLSISRAERRVGRAGAVGSRPDRLRLGRRAPQLLHRPRVRAARRGPGRPLLAARPAAHGEGHPQVPRRHLAGAADGRRPGAAAAGDDPRVRPQGRREDEQDDRQRRRPVPLHRRVRDRRAALLPRARGPLRRGRHLHRRGLRGPLLAGARPTSSATSSTAS